MENYFPNFSVLLDQSAIINGNHSSEIPRQLFLNCSINELYREGEREKGEMARPSCNAGALNSNTH